MSSTVRVLKQRAKFIKKITKYMKKRRKYALKTKIPKWWVSNKMGEEYAVPRLCELAHKFKNKNGTHEIPKYPERLRFKKLELIETYLESNEGLNKNNGML